MTFSPKQQHIVAIFCLCYGLWLLWNVSADSRQRLEHERLPEPTPDAMPFYLDAEVDLNRADAEKLQFLPHIGPVLAERIVAYREQHGKFQSPAALQHIHGIGPKIVHRVQYYCVFQ